MEEHLIDTELDETPKDVILEIIRWWERKRLLFNSLIIGVVVFTIVQHLMKHPNYQFNFSLDFITRSVFYFLFLNACYCAGWGIKLLAYYYFRIHTRTAIIDLILFVIGTLFTSLVTYEGYRSYLYVANYF